MADEDWLSLGAASARFGVSIGLLHQMIATDELRGYRRGVSITIRTEDLVLCLKGRGGDDGLAGVPAET